MANKDIFEFEFDTAHDVNIVHGGALRLEDTYTVYGFKDWTLYELSRPS